MVVRSPSRAKSSSTTRRPPMRRLFLTLALLLPAIATAADFTVSPGQSIASALSQMHAGDTLTLHGGTYDAHDLRPPSGVTVQGAAGQTVIIRPTGRPSHAFDVMGQGVTLRNLTLDG